MPLTVVCIKLWKSKLLRKLFAHSYAGDRWQEPLTCRSALAGFIGAVLRPFPVCLVQHVQIRILVSETFQSFMQTTVSDCLTIE